MPLKQLLINYFKKSFIHFYEKLKKLSKYYLFFFFLLFFHKNFPKIVRPFVNISLIIIIILIVLLVIFIVVAYQKEKKEKKIFTRTVRTRLLGLWGHLTSTHSYYYYFFLIGHIHIIKIIVLILRSYERN